MEKFDFDTPVDRNHTASLKWEHYGDRDIIPLWVADMDFRSPPAVIQALNTRVEHGVFGYGTTPGTMPGVICEMLAARYNWRIEPHHLVWLPGLVCGLNLACRSTGAGQDEVITLVPVYPPFLTAPKNSGRKLVTVPLVDNGDKWMIDFDRLEKSITPRTRLLLLCNPHNPVGRIYSRRELERLVSLCAGYDIVICSDEIHCDLILDKNSKHIVTATVNQEAAARTITLMAPSKTFNIPGLGCSFAVISNKKLRDNFIRSMSGIVPAVNVLGFAAAEAAYRHGWDWLESLLEYLRGNSRLVEKEIGSMENLAMHHVEATYLAWIDARRVDANFPGRFFEASGVGMSEGSEFGFPGFVRLNFGCPRSLLRKALQRMKRAAGKR